MNYFNAKNKCFEKILCILLQWRYSYTRNERFFKFQEDHTFMLILRLRHNVIKTGLRSISLSYSRISLADVAQKLMLGSKEDAEFIVAKAIRDGVIEVSEKDTSIVHRLFLINFSPNCGVGASFLKPPQSI